MDLSLIISVIGNILLFLLLLLFVVLYFTTYASTPNSCQNITPTPPPAIPTICTDSSCNYIIKTVDGLYLTSCFSCNQNGNLSVVASEKYNGDTVQFIGAANGSFQIQMNVAMDPSGVYFFNLVPETITKGVLKLTRNQNDRGTVFNLIPYLFSYSNNTSGNNLYQIGTPISNTLLGEDDTTCNVKEGIPITDGFNFYVNTPNGLNSRSLFLIIPSMIYGPPPTPINPSSPPIVPNPLPVPTPVQSTQGLSSGKAASSNSGSGNIASCNSGSGNLSSGATSLSTILTEVPKRLIRSEKSKKKESTLISFET